MRVVVLLLFALAACHSDPQPAVMKPGDRPPLPPASGTPVGYLIDAASDLKLRDEQLTKLEAIDGSLSARDADIDVQLRQIEHPEDEEQLSPQEVKAGKKRQRRNLAPGQSLVTTKDSDKLHQIRNANDKDALGKAWVVLDPDQQTTAKHILEDRGVEVPGTKKAEPPPSDDGKPVPGLD